MVGFVCAAVGMIEVVSNEQLRIRLIYLRADIAACLVKEHRSRAVSTTLSSLMRCQISIEPAHLSTEVIMDFENMTDMEIRQQLTALGQNVGPVTPTTRSLHLKKLRNLMAMQGDAPSSRSTPPPPTLANGDENRHTNYIESHHANYIESRQTNYIESEPMVEDEGPLTQLRVREVMSETPRITKPATVQATHQSFDDGSDGEMAGQESMRYLSPEELELETTYNRSVSGSPVAPQVGSIKKVQFLSRSGKGISSEKSI
ncbi:hypothetical protein Y032_0001g301 [Ancylostoma ceylanicum]|uniref:LEM domain-containing protein n=1 Tax=Ancylostoma ceylanicum TaxID=53326 RepID=A0A016W5C1_9BILA|nr:hypothetical protein Y032_0001g301 [Ancylostoma ceylanicum]